MPGLIGPARQNPPASPLHAWRFLITDAMIESVVVHTNEKIGKMQASYSKFKRRLNTRSQFSPSFIYTTDKTEIKAFVELLYLDGDFKSGHEDLRSLWATDETGRSIFRCTMYLARFSFLSCCLRFDNDETRRERIKENKLAAISDLFIIKFVQTLKNAILLELTWLLTKCLSPSALIVALECTYQINMPDMEWKYKS